MDDFTNDPNNSGDDPIDPAILYGHQLEPVNSDLLDEDELDVLRDPVKPKKKKTKYKPSSPDDYIAELENDFSDDDDYDI